MSQFSLKNIMTEHGFPYFLQRVVAPIALVILLVLLLVYGIQLYIAGQEKTLGARVNGLIDDFEGVEFEAGTLAYEEELLRIASEFDAVYKTAGRSDNGKRALYHAGLTYYAAGKFDLAEETFTTLFDKDKKFYLAPQSLYFKGLALEELERYQEAIQAFEQYEELYGESSFLTNEVILAKARNYGWIEDYVQAEKLYGSIIKELDDGSLAAPAPNSANRIESNEQTYSDKAKEVLDLLKIRSHYEPSSE